MCRVYDKTVEVQKMQKEWWHDVWQAHEWDGASLSTVVRIEVQSRREFLKQMRVDTLDDLSISAGIIIAHI